MGWEELIDALDELETEVEYDGYFCSIKDAVIIVTLGSMCELKSVMRIHSWATTGTVSKFLAESFGIKRIPCYGRQPSNLRIKRTCRKINLNEIFRRYFLISTFYFFISKILTVNRIFLQCKEFVKALNTHYCL